MLILDQFTFEQCCSRGLRTAESKYTSCFSTTVAVSLLIHTSCDLLSLHEQHMLIEEKDCFT